MTTTITIFTKDSNYNEMKEAAKSLGLKFVGISKETLANNINEANNLLNNTQTTKKKWHEEEGAFPYEINSHVQIQESYHYKGIHNRIVIVTGPSHKKNTLKGFLLNEKTGQPQKCNIALKFEDVKPYELESTNE